MLSQNTLIYCVDVGNESEMMIFCKLVAKVETAPLTNTAPTPLAFLFNISYRTCSGGAPNNHVIAMAIAL